MRRDYHIDNESTIVLLYSIGGGAPGRREIHKSMPVAVANGWAAPVELVQDDSFNLRVIIGELSTPEQTEWVGKAEWSLRVPAGRLVLEAGLEPDLTDEEINAVTLEVPPGDYRAIIYAYLPGVNSWACLRAAGHTGTLGEWFRRTHRDKPMPDWLVIHLAEAPEEDPGHEREWQSFLLCQEFVEAQLRLRRNPPIDLLLHLVPLAAGVPCRNKKTRRPEPATANARKPEIFPLGLLTEGLVPAKRPDFVWTPRAPKAGELLNSVPEARALIEGGSVQLRIDQIHCLARISTWCNQFVWGALLIGNVPGVSPADLGVRQSLYLGIEKGVSELLISLMPKDKLSIAQDLRTVETALYQLPDGTTLELVMGDYAGVQRTADHRYRGELHNGVWSVCATFPPVKSSILEEAVTYSAYLDYGRIEGRDEADAESILALLNRASAIMKTWETRRGQRVPVGYQEWISVIRPSRSGNVITLGLHDEGELWNAARYVFAMRYSDTWQAWDWWDEMFPQSRPTD